MSHYPASHCEVASVAPAADDTEVVVRCCAGAVAVDSEFSLAYME